MMSAGMRWVAGVCLGMTLVLVLVGCSSLGGSGGEGPSDEMLGTWLFENPIGDDEQMAVFGDGRVVVLYSNGHVDETKVVDGVVKRLGEYGVRGVKMSVDDDGRLVQRHEMYLITKVWIRIDEVPRRDLLRPLV